MARKARAGACSSSERPGCGFTDGDTLRDNHAMNEIASPSAEQAQQDIAEEFALFGDWSERYQYLIDVGKQLPPFPEACIFCIIDVGNPCLWQPIDCFANNRRNTLCTSVGSYDVECFCS